MIGAMGSLVFALVAYIRAFLITRHKLALEMLLCGSNSPFSSESNLGPRSAAQTGSFGRRCGDCIRNGLMLILVRPETVVSWHRAGIATHRQ